MGALGLLIRRALRTNRRAILGLALVIALAGGVSLTALATARRTASAFPRYLEASHASDVALNPIRVDDASELDHPYDPLTATLGILAKGRILPEVVEDATYLGLEYMFLVDGEDRALDIQPEIVGSMDGRFVSQDSMAIVAGRLPKADRPDEVAINRQTAERLHLRVGSTVRMLVPDVSGGLDIDPRDMTVLDRQTAHVTGIGLFPEEVLSDDFDGSARLLATPALTNRVQESAGTYVWQGLRLRPGTSVDEAIRAYRAQLPDGFEVNVQRTDTQVDRVERSVRPVVVALGVFGAAAGLAALTLGGLGALRLMGASEGPDAQTLEAVGLSRSRRRLVAAAPSLTAAALGALGAVALAVGLSPLGPVGPVREVEPRLGVDVDRTVIFLGGTILLVLVAGVAVVAAHRATRRSVELTERTLRPSWIVGRIASAGLGPSAVVGAGHALGGAGRSDGVPTRSTIAACTVSVVALATAVTFGASVRSLLDTPHLYGWTADLGIDSGGGYDFLDPDGAEQAAATRGVAALTLAGFGALPLRDLQVNAIGILPVEGAPLVTVVDGSLPDESREVALGASTARELGVGIGDDVKSGTHRLRVVGIVALPAIGPMASAHPSLGQGALMTLGGLSGLNQSAYPSLALVRVAKGLDPAREAPRLTTAVAKAMSESPPDYAASFSDLRPSEVIGLGPASRTAYLLAALLGAAAVVAFGLTLSSSVRRRRRTFAVLRALGLDRRDLRRTVRWQLNLAILVALVVGVPCGIAIGRVAWTAFAAQLGSAGDPRVPVLLFTLAVAGLVVLTNLVGEWPARSAGRRSRAATLEEQL